MTELGPFYLTDTPTNPVRVNLSGAALDGRDAAAAVLEAPSGATVNLPSVPIVDGSVYFPWPADFAFDEAGIWHLKITLTGGGASLAVAPITVPVRDRELEQEALAGYVGVSSNDPYIRSCLEEARALVANLIGSTEIPYVVVQRAILEAGSELYHRTKAPMGISQYATADGSPIRVSRDPLIGARAILSPFFGTGIA